jgi:hypothetical protein
VRASLVVKCQLTCRWSVLTVLCQAASSVLRVSRSSMRRSRHWRVRADSSISAMLSQDPCLGVWWISSRWASVRALAGGERFVERSEGVGVEVVHHQHDPCGVGVVHAQEVVDLVRPVDHGASWSGHDPAPARQWLDPHEDRAGSAPYVLGVLAAIAAGCCGDRITGVREELVGLLIHAHHRHLGVIRSGVDVQDVFHPGGELAVGRRWDGPAFLQMRTQRPLFKTRPMVE